MGNCISFDDEYICCRCNQTRDFNRNLAHKSCWVSAADGKRYCRPCYLTFTKETEKYERERAFYAKAKTQLYPKSETKQRLKRINTEEPWQGQSFYDSYRPPSTLAHLVQALTGRKGTGFIGDSAADVSHGHNTGDQHLDSVDEDRESADPAQLDKSHREKLEKLEAEFEFVEVEDDLTNHGSESAYQVLQASGSGGEQKEVLVGEFGTCRASTSSGANQNFNDNGSANSHTLVA